MIEKMSKSKYLERKKKRQNIIAERVKILKDDWELTYTELAEKMGMYNKATSNKTRLCHFLRCDGMYEMPIENLIILSENMLIDVEWLLGIQDINIRKRDIR